MLLEQPDNEDDTPYQSVAMLRERIEKQDREIERLWQRIHALSETLEDRSVH